ncbi:hypothetical protein [Streptomyces sp. NPDC095613]
MGGIEALGEGVSGLSAGGAVSVAPPFTSARRRTRGGS